MSITYLKAINIGFPLVFCHSSGDGSIYEDLVWDGGEPLPAKTTLDEWIASNPSANAEKILTKYQFRKLFSLNERIAIDNFQANGGISAQDKAVLSTIMKDLEQSGEVQLENPDVVMGVNFLEQVGLIAAGRAAQILSNTPVGA